MFYNLSYYSKNSSWNWGLLPIILGGDAGKSGAKYNVEFPVSEMNSFKATEKDSTFSVLWFDCHICLPSRENGDSGLLYEQKGRRLPVHSTVHKLAPKSMKQQEWGNRKTITTSLSNMIHYLYLLVFRLIVLNQILFTNNSISNLKLVYNTDF